MSNSHLSSGPDNTVDLHQIDRVSVAGLLVHNVEESTCVELIANACRRELGIWIVTANADIARLVARDDAVSILVTQADLIVADGMPLIWASRILGQPLRARVCGSNLVWSIAERAAKERLSLFLLGGGRPDTAHRASLALRNIHPNLKIAGTFFPPFGFEKTDAQIVTIRDILSEAKPDIVYVALGFPKAERLIKTLRHSLPGTSWIGVGISLSFIAGEVRRAPRWMQSIGLEWMHRLFQEPKRLVARYLWHDMPFVFILLYSALMDRFRRRRSRDDP